MVCLDTNFLILLIRQNSQAISKLRTLKGPLYTTIINLAELYKGAYLSNNVSRETQKVDNLMRFIRVIMLDRSSSKLFGQLNQQLRSNRLEDADLLIASIAISNNETLLTRDQDFRRISTLQVDTW